MCTLLGGDRSVSLTTSMERVSNSGCIVIFIKCHDGDASPLFYWHCHSCMSHNSAKCVKARGKPKEGS